ncbi:restriction endonuclease subunit S [Microbacterium maritypicum]|uniref:Uncharacterized protein n=1 Tax=Microbacterium maritypicum TaxID=33918 RepID=A0ACD4B2T8_MICMQ|nr:hypothetical protein [Microbacterium liquefaciens]UTT51814.1 hypothetical protein NMQ05_12020 [Microbacterium liquefaciens]
MTQTMFSPPTKDRGTDAWEVRSLRSILSPRSERNRPDLPLLSVARERGVFVRSTDDANHNAIPEDLTNYKIARKGDLVVNKMKAWQGSLGLAPVDGIVSPAYFVFKADFAVPRYGEYLFRSKPYVAKFGAASDGVRIGQWDLNIPRMRDIEVHLPPAAEQAAIVKYLAHANARIDKAIATKRRLIALLDEQREKVRADLFLGLPGHAARLKDVATIQTGLTLGKDYGAQELTAYPYLRVANVQMGRVDASTIAYVAVPEREAVRTTLRAGDVLMTEGGDIDKLGRGVVWDGQIEPCLHQNHVFAVRCKDVILPEFLASWLSGPVAREYFYLTAKKTTNLASTNSTTLGKLPVVLPSLVEQGRILRDIEDRTASMDVTIGKAEREILLLREFRTRLVADVVTGQVDVRAIAASLPDTPEQDTDLDLMLEDVLEEALSEGED